MNSQQFIARICQGFKRQTINTALQNKFADLFFPAIDSVRFQVNVHPEVFSRSLSLRPKPFGHC